VPTGEPAVAVVEQTAEVDNDDAVSPETKPVYVGVNVGGAAP
jgi:hypothetical protein